MDGRTVFIDCRTVSQLDGKRGRVLGFERGMVQVRVDGYVSHLLFWPDELKEAPQ